MSQLQPDPRCRNRPGIKLSLTADVERTTAECDGDAQSNDDERNGSDQGGRGECIPRAECPIEQRRQSNSRIVSGQVQTGGQQSQPDQDRGKCPPYPIHVLGSWSIMRPISSRV